MKFYENFETHAMVFRAVAKRQTEALASVILFVIVD